MRFDAGWNGWWTCLLPAEIISELGLPIPLFFQWDDIEYGIRARFAGHPTITLPNAGVWHADFHLKDYDDWSRYFSIRNGLIVSSIYGPFDGKVISKFLLRKITQLIVGMQYGLAATFVKAAEDFLQGPDFLNDGGQSALVDVRALRDEYPETKMQPASAVGAESDPHTQMTVVGVRARREPRGSGASQARSSTVDWACRPSTGNGSCDLRRLVACVVVRKCRCHGRVAERRPASVGATRSRLPSWPSVRPKSVGSCVSAHLR